jgi:DNA (cytosine-5)-methyltransferase 1
VTERGLIVDSFAGGGGASTGIEWALGRSPDIAINHSPGAIAMHALNHPETRHFCEDVWQVDPVEATQGRPVDLAWFSPDCTHFSKAKGGKPRSKKIRGLAWVVYRWAKAVRPRLIMLENVEEFADWGPLLDDGRPCPLRRGLTFRRWWRQIENLGYELDARELRACDYGAPTSRKRLFIIARCDGQPIRWPEPTHGPGLQPYRTAADCIDFSLPCPSIFGRKKALAEATLRRIAAGVMRYVVHARQPFLVMSLDHQSSGPTGGLAGADDPVTTITAKARHCLVAPTLATLRGTSDSHIQASASAVDAPLRTVSAGGTHHALVAAFLAKHYGGVVGQPLDKTIGTITGRDHHSLVQAFLVAYYGNERDGRPLDEPMGTIVSRDRFGLVTVHGEPHYIADIGMRMLQPPELFKAQGFPDDVKLIGTKTSQVELCGNSVSPPLAAALVRANVHSQQLETQAA